MFGEPPYRPGELDELRREAQRQEAKDNYRNFIKGKNKKAHK